MRDLEIRQSETVDRMCDFGLGNSSDFPPTSLGGQKFAELNVLRTEMNRLGAQQSEGSGGAKTSTEAKRLKRERLRKLLRALCDTAEAMEPNHPGISNTFRFPRTRSDEVLINFARACITSATPLKSEFLQYELPATFLEDLAEAVEDFEEEAGSKNLNTRKRVSATAAIRNVLERAMQLKRELDPIVRNKYRDNPAKLAEWESASHVERTARKKAAKKAPPES